METKAFIAGFVSLFLDNLAIYEITKDTNDFLPFVEFVKPHYEPLSECAKIPQYPITKKETKYLRVCELVQNAVNTGYLSTPDKLTILEHLDTLSNGIKF